MEAPGDGLLPGPLQRAIRYQKERQIQSFLTTLIPLIILKYDHLAKWAALLGTKMSINNSSM